MYKHVRRMNLAKDASVQHIVFSSSLVLNNPNAAEIFMGLSTAPAVLNNADVETLVKASGLTWTLLRPRYFLTNLLPQLVHWMYPDMKTIDLSTATVQIAFSP
jgi:uncharacterized protein YbjT (DUF2867 family)